MKIFQPVRINPWREIAILMIILMEVSWITPWFRSLTPETYAVNSARVFITLAMMVLIANIIIRVMDYLRIKKSLRQGLIVIILIICSVIGIKLLLYTHESTTLSALFTRPIRSFLDIQSIIPVEFLVIIAVLIGFWRGITLAQQPIDPSMVKNRFWLGIIMFIAFIFLITFATRENPGEFFSLFLFSSLVGVSAARMSVVGMVRGGIENQFNRSWFFGIFFAALIVVGLSSLFGELIANKFGWIGALIAGVIGSIIILIWIVINPVISVFIAALGNIFNNSKFIDGLQNSLQNLNELVMGFGGKISELMKQSGLMSFLARWSPTIKTIVLVTILLTIIFGIAVWITISLWRDRERRKISDEEKSSIRVENLFQSILNLLLQGWNRAVTSVEELTDLKKRRRIRAAARIRQIYSDLLELCEDLGMPRPNAVTPLEFIPRINQLFPEFQPEITLITIAYLDVRYGLMPENQNELTNIETAWIKVHSVGQEKIQEKKHLKK
jgi:hypothetical protein